MQNGTTKKKLLIVKVQFVSEEIILNCEKIHAPSTKSYASAVGVKIFCFISYLTDKLVHSKQLTE